MAALSGVDYNTFISNLEARGLQTTALYSDGETNFQQYGEALSADLKNEIMQSFDNDQDYILQQQISELFKSQNVMDSDSFIYQCQSLGLSCSVDYVSTSYISDYKSSQSNEVISGAIAVYTISDGKGGEIKIADANGNGSLETEELFMNEILGDINNEIGAMGGSVSNLQNGETINQGPTQEEFNKKVEEYLMVGFKETEATALANMVLGTTGGTYTGTYEAVSQEEFNEKVESYLKKGYSLKNATLSAQAMLNSDDKFYTGDNLQKIKKELKEKEEKENLKAA